MLDHGYRYDTHTLLLSIKLLLKPLLNDLSRTDVDAMAIFLIIDIFYDKGESSESSSN